MRFPRGRGARATDGESCASWFLRKTQLIHGIAWKTSDAVPGLSVGRQRIAVAICPGDAGQISAEVWHDRFHFGKYGNFLV